MAMSKSQSMRKWASFSKAYESRGVEVPGVNQRLVMLINFRPDRGLTHMLGFRPRESNNTVVFVQSEDVLFQACWLFGQIEEL